MVGDTAEAVRIARVAKWTAIILGGILLLLVAAVFVLTSVVNPNRYRGKVEAIVADLAGRPLVIEGNLKIIWYPSLGIATGSARLDNPPGIAGPPIMEWQSIAVAAQLGPLLHGEIIGDRILLRSPRIHLRRDAQGHGNWEGLFGAPVGTAPSQKAATSTRAVQIGGIELHDGTVDYVDEGSGLQASLSDVQADAILNMRLRNLRKLEEMEIRQEDKALRAERKKLKDLIGSETEQWKRIADEVKEVRAKFGPKTPLGKRRTAFAQAPVHDEAAIEEALVEREPITVVVSEKGWIRTLRGTVSDLSGVAFKTDDGPKFAFPAETTSKCLVFATNGRFYTLDAAKLPGGRGHGEPIRLFVDLEQEADVVAVFRHQGGRKFLVASTEGRGFVVPEDECLANTRKGKQVLNVAMPDEARAIAVAEGELVAAIGDNRKMLVFPLEQVPEMTRGRGVRLQRYKDGGLSDVKAFKVEEGLSWTDTAGRAFSLTLKELADWRGNRADAGRLAPKGFPRSNTFSQVPANGKAREEK